MSDLPAWLDYVNAVSTGAAALLAAGALVQTARNSNKNEQALIRERRIEFELNVLTDLVELASQSSSVVTRNVRMRARAAVLDIEVIPITRAVLALESTPEAIGRVAAREPDRMGAGQDRVDDWAAEIIEELLAAVQARLGERA